MKNYIYSLVDPRNGQIRYIGKAVNPKRRYSSTFTFELNTSKDTHKTLWIKSLFKATGQYPIIEILREVNSEHIAESEIFCINEYRRLGCDLTNTAEGGIGGNTGNYNPPGLEALRRAKQNKRTTNLKGKKQTPEHIAKRMQNTDRKKHSEAVRQHQAKRKIYEEIFGVQRKPAWNKGVPMVEETRKKLSESAKTQWHSLTKEEQEERVIKSSIGFKRIHEEVKLGLREHPAKGLVPWNKGIKVPAEIHEKAWKTRKETSGLTQREMLILIGNDSNKSWSMVDRTLRGEYFKVKKANRDEIWNSYLKLKNEVQTLKIINKPFE